jgi:Concanavalin A-like lectin/glucanases superfamily/Calx-beta domain
MAGKISFVNDIYNVSENGTWLNGKPQIERTQDFTGAVTVRVSVSSASKTGNKATKDSDFTVPSQLLSWNDGELGNKEVNLSILQDNIIESDEVFLLSLTKITNAEYGDRKKCTVIISDDSNQQPVSSGINVTIGSDYPVTTPPQSTGEIFIAQFGSKKQLVYTGYDNNGTLAWKRISTSPIREVIDPSGQGDFTGQIWVNVTNSKAWIYSGNNWQEITNSDINVDLNPIQNNLDSLNQFRTIFENKVINAENNITNLQSQNQLNSNNSPELLLKFNDSHGSTNFIDESPNNYLIVGNGNPIISNIESKFGDSSLYLDGASNLTLPNINFLGDFTIECWVKTTQLASVGIISNLSNQQALWLESNGNCSYYQSNWSSPDLIGNFISDNQWHHIAIVRNRFTLMIYVDGLFKQEFNYNKLNSNIPSLFYIGSMDANSRFFNGYIDNLRISNKAIYTPELYPNGFTLPDEIFNVSHINYSVN